MALVFKENNNIKGFSVTQHVGKGKPNRWSDCMLVLYLMDSYASIRRLILHAAISDFPDVDHRTDYCNIDLISQAIRSFKSDQVFLGRKLKIDGKIHCPPSITDWDRYTIGALNEAYYWYYEIYSLSRGFGRHEIDPFQHALEDSNMHPILKGELLASYGYHGLRL